jgi:4-amino-4-deoxy-L-arabinose transferase-like glycosyltransferase
MLFLASFYWLAPLTSDLASNFDLVHNAIVLVQLLLVSSAASAVALAGYYLAGKWGSALSSFLAISYLAIGANAATMFTESVTLFLMSVILLSIVALVTRQGSHWFWLTVFGLFSGMYLITRAAIAIYIAGFLVFWILYNWKSWKKAAVQSFVAGLCIMLFMGPWIVRNYALHEELIIFNSASDNPLFISTFYDGMGEQIPTEEELAKFGVVSDPSRGPLANTGAIARYRLDNAREEWGLRRFVYVRYWRHIRDYPDRPTLMLYSNEFLQTRSDILGNREYSGPWSGDEGGRFWQYTLFVHRAVIVLAIAGVLVAIFRTRGSVRLCYIILALFPAYMFAVHLQILYLPRYMYQTLPVTFVISSGLVYLLPNKMLPSCVKRRKALETASHEACNPGA